MTKKEEIIRICMDIFSESGVQGLTMKAIADRVQISEPAIYRHFQNKRAVIIAMITQIRNEILRCVDDITRQPLHEIEKLHRIFGYHLFYLKEKKAITLELLSESFFRNHPEVRRHMSRLMRDYHVRIRGIIAVGIERKEISEKIDPVAASILFLGALQHLLTIFKLKNNEQEIDLLSGAVFNQFRTILEGGTDL